MISAKSSNGRVIGANDKVVVASIGPKTTETALAAGLKVTVTADEATIPGLVQALEKHFREGGS